MQAIHKSIPAANKMANKPGPRRNRRQTLGSLLRHKEMLQALGSGALMLMAWGMHDWVPLLSVLVYVTAYAVGGWGKARDGIETLVKERDLDVNLLMIAAAMGAAAIGYWNEGAMLIFIFALSGALESFATERSRKDISALISLKPETALRIDKGGMKVVPVTELEVGDLLLVKPGEVIPADGVIESGSSSVNQASITGESIPVDKTAGAGVYAGTLNGEGALYIKVNCPSEGSLFSKIITLVEEAQSEVPRTQRFIQRFEGIYARIVVGVTLCLVVLAPLVLGWTWEMSFYKSMVFLVVASPCALVSSIMPAMLSAISNGARKGLLFKGGAHLENLGYTSVVAFDKTGTLTMGAPEVTDLIVADGYEPDEVLRYCASAENLSDHPLARAIVKEAEKRGLELLPAEEMKSVAGWGIEARVGGEVWKIGKPSAMGAGLPEWCREEILKLESEGKTISVVVHRDCPVGLLALRDNIRPQAREAVARLRKLGIQTAMLTGDHNITATAIGREAGVDQVYGDLLPAGKVEHIKMLREKYGHVVMVGDGVNDAPALATASVGIAMGASGSGTALEVADVVLMNDDLERIAGAITLSRRARRIVKMNIAFAISVILLLIAGNFVQGIPLPLGVIGHEGSTILVILNGLRLLR
ncbi:heavy metal translocating P-type ATPase [Paenibacillus sp. YPG26]|uniref:heavy metal translocating P-type ATPase n=1 Tax=Paenibacillus sp. YPG26 TaxID=2878915 RepID=UPI00203B8949|nr:heavy metal translocating P-type ATPase [Paenibacillus sp. YPG26]USB32641.1 cadmium-translocating P-type ATPase [Paenibacillus sp. YPG26]